MRLRIRIPPRTSCSLFSLPEEVILLILKFLTADELMNLRMVCTRLKQLVDGSPSLWISASFVGVWPSLKILPLMQRAANLGNVEALIKLGLAHLYNEGISESGENGVNAIENGRLAAEFFCRAESALPSGVPFTWFFVRPPWAPSGVCCKSCVFNSMVELCSNSEVDKSMLYCVGKILSLHEDQKKKEESLEWLNNAASRGSCHAAYELWKLRFCTGPLEPYSRLKRLRELRDCATPCHPDAQLTLALEYARGNLGGVTKTKVAEFISQFVLRSRPLNSHKLFTFQTELNSTMRYILVDWLVEVAVMKDFSSQIVHIAVHCVDQYLLRRQVQRSELQLLGITCILIAARFQGTDIVTIREAAWLTDGTYKYEEVVRMMGEVMSCIKGQVRVLTTPDFLKLFCSLAAVDQRTECIAGYIADLSILHTDYGRYSPALMAASSVVLANAIQDAGSPWPPHMQEMTGLRIFELLDCTLHLHQQCLLDDFPTDHRNVKLKAIKERYSDERFMKVSEIKVPSRDVLCRYLIPTILQSEADSEQQSSASSSSQSADKHPDHAPHVTADDSIFNTSISSLSESGYDADMEDEGELVTDATFVGEERFNGFADDENDVLNKRPRNSSFLNCDEFARSSSTPSIIHEASSSGFDFEMRDMETDSEPVSIDNEIHSASGFCVHEPVSIDNEIHSASGFCVPVVMEAEDNVELGESGAKPLASRLLIRQPLRRIENSNIVNTISVPWKSQQRSSAWRTRNSRSVPQ